ncbi:DUF6037 family protein [Saccharospirillum salsuginis]|uniref:Rloe protein n=1 Tax=Saccharospirillum salsuginis TaxID=418750 RepID=A0A918KM92_9GAMM|nr:DUF6037 family protein [Saccharospirillum salsuginis]GGX69004.1 hypothetical protein GCM10007392_40850 [Saccharospirillum salsuginis]
MKLPGLIPLYRSMKDQNIGRYKFRYQLNNLTFDCLFFIDLEPFELVMGCLGHNFAIFREVQHGFEIEPFIEPKETFFALLEALRTANNSASRFDPKQFFLDFDQQIPSQANPRNIATAQDVVRYYSDIEEADKVHFCGWLDNSLRRNRVTESNLEKTRRLMGQQIHDFSQRRNLSTRWTNDRSMAVEFYYPD